MTKVSRRQFVGTTATAAGILIVPRHVLGGTVPMIIHGSPQKAAYASPDEWPTISSQAHWAAPSANAGLLSHTHIDMKFPLYAEVSAPFTVPFTLILYRTAGAINYISGRSFTSWTLDAPAKLPLAGDPAGVVVYTGTVTFDPARAGVLHGWYPHDLQVVTRFTDGIRLFNTLRLSVFSKIDPSKPQVGPGDGTGIRTRSTCSVTDPTEKPYVERWGANIIEFAQMLPVLGPLSTEKPWQLQAIAWNYSAAGGALPDGFFELRVDPNLHAGIPGTTVDSATARRTQNVFSLPDSIPDGTHKAMYMWRRPTFDGKKELGSNLVFTVTVGPGGAVQPPNNQPLLGASPGAPPPPPPPHGGQ